MNERESSVNVNVEKAWALDYLEESEKLKMGGWTCNNLRMVNVGWIVGVISSAVQFGFRIIKVKPSRFVFQMKKTSMFHNIIAEHQNMETSMPAQYIISQP
eukprot:118717_1